MPRPKIGEIHISLALWKMTDLLLFHYMLIFYLCLHARHHFHSRLHLFLILVHVGFNIISSSFVSYITHVLCIMSML